MKQLIVAFLLFPMMIWSQSGFDAAEKLFKEEKFDQARPIFENFLKNNPSNLKAIEYLGDIAGRNKSWDTAIGYYKKLKQLKPSEANYYYKYGGALGMKASQVSKFKALGMIDEVKGAFEKAIVFNPKHIEARWALIELYIQLPGIIGGSESKAIKYSDELLRFSPVDGYLSKGHIDEYFKRYKIAEQNYKKAIAIGGSKVSYLMLANLYKNKMDDPEKAKSVLEEFRKKSQMVNR
ncbi:tetratricopeptide repeat protein [Flavobacterium sp.]|uniref:tetratricopeptide repeat protein n=1 Tax=Flavobacterium sp. TaxID=239 RepID=UPI001B4094E3|nr:tetratricopeptide repeat protein [Flavobacterium sp.]MBP6180919.1 tetratricopeptide repeat protein [Flavobacterium sp.]